MTVRPLDLAFVTTQESDNAAKQNREAAVNDYIDWHYEQFGCAPTTGYGPAPAFIGGETS